MMLVTIVGCVQFDSRTVQVLTVWSLDARWSPVPCSVADLPDFLLYMSLTEKTAGSCFKLPVFC